MCSMRSYLFALTGMVLTILGAGAKAQTQPGAPPAPANANLNVGIDQKLDSQVPLDISFQDETNKTIKLGDYFGQKPVVLVMPFYRCAGMCTLELDGMAKAFNAMKFSAGHEFNVVTVSIDSNEPWTLAAAKKREYLDLYPRPEADKGWHFLTGSEESIQKLAGSVGFRFTRDPATHQIAHAVGIIILTPEGKVSRYIYGVDYSPRDVRLALVDASANKIGSLADRFTLLCSHYDVVTGKYGVAVDKIIKLACSGTVLILGSFLFAMFRMERRRAADGIDQVGFPDKSA